MITYQQLVAHKEKPYVVRWRVSRNDCLKIIEVIAENSRIMPDSFHVEIKSDLINQLHIPSHKQTA